MSKLDREKIKNKFGGKCAYCGKELDKFHIDHVKPLYRNHHANPNELWKKEIEERKKESNLFPACPRCNRWKGVLSLESFRRDLESQIERLNRYNANYRLAKDYGLIQENKIKIIFLFEKWEQINK
jgi:5-methylcytosine-specific restriction endonuclease McrA